ncbi:hypothetical protein RJT34_33221 [Clitoria ternatea]|uniref:Secreted protein n=1 Tax=Clitoria ternatea TaxID=43366 RepID=A0AAN9I5B1_CLITE
MFFSFCRIFVHCVVAFSCEAGFPPFIGQPAKIFRANFKASLSELGRGSHNQGAPNEAMLRVDVGMPIGRGQENSLVLACSIAGRKRETCAWPRSSLALARSCSFKRKKALTRWHA